MKKTLPVRQTGVILTSLNVVKTHGRELTVDPKEREGLSTKALAKFGSEFIINMPLNK